MSKINITPARLEALKLIADGKVRQHRFGYGAWRVMGAQPTVVGQLISLKLAAWGKFDEDDILCSLTEAGAAELAKAIPSQPTGGPV